MGILIAIEGIDGAGKTTQVQLLAEALRGAGEDPVQSKEPTDGAWGQKIRVSAQNGRMPLDEELQAFIEDRKEHVAQKIAPALGAHKIVILDRYFYSTIAYQGARGADPQELARQMELLAPIPDAVFLLDVSPTVAIGRIANGRGEVPNEFERMDKLTAVRRVFDWLANSDSRITKLNGERSISDIHQDILVALLRGAFKKYRAKPYECDCFYCSYGATDSCRWLTLQERLLSDARQQLRERIAL